MSLLGSAPPSLGFYLCGETLAANLQVRERVNEGEIQTQADDDWTDRLGRTLQSQKMKGLLIRYVQVLCSSDPPT